MLCCSLHPVIVGDPVSAGVEISRRLLGPPHGHDLGGVGAAGLEAAAPHAGVLQPRGGDHEHAAAAGGLTPDL